MERGGQRWRLVARQELGRAVPSGDDVLGERTLGGARRRVDASRHAEVCDLELAVSVHQQVGRLEVAVQHLPCEEGAAM